MKQFVVTPAAGKRLIAKGIAQHPEVKRALAEATIVVVAGTTNGYVAEELLESIGQSEGFSRRGFIRGITVPPYVSTSEIGRLPDESEFPGDVVIAKGHWVRGKSIFDVVDDLREETSSSRAQTRSILHESRRRSLSGTRRRNDWFNPPGSGREASASCCLWVSRNACCRT